MFHQQTRVAINAITSTLVPVPLRSTLHQVLVFNESSADKASQVSSKSHSLLNTLDVLRVVAGT